jgi:hypothetical protein
VNGLDTSASPLGWSGQLLSATGRQRIPVSPLNPGCTMVLTLADLAAPLTSAVDPPASKEFSGSKAWYRDEKGEWQTPRANDEVVIGWYNA